MHHEMMGDSNNKRKSEDGDSHRSLSDVDEEDRPEHQQQIEGTSSTCSSSISLSSQVTPQSKPATISYPLVPSPLPAVLTPNRSTTTKKSSILIRSVPATPTRIEYRLQTTTPAAANTMDHHHPQTTAAVVAGIPLVSVRQGLAKKANVVSLQSWSKLAMTLDGRDKITKVLQYVSRLLAWWLASPRCAALKASLITSRKAFRLGRSLMEFQKIRSLGLLERIGCYLQQKGVGNDDDDDDISSLFLQKCSRLLYAVYTPFAKSLSDYPQEKNPPDAPFWKLAGNALKMLGLLGFWGGDNVSFLTQSGFLDDYSSSEKGARMAKRKMLVTKASTFANRSYFAGSVAGLLTNWRCYWEHRQETLRNLVAQGKEVDEEALKKAQEEQFTLFLALLKSCCDVLVFSNNPGVDLWKKYRGKKMHEGFHCLCGLTSASTVLYNNYPDASTK